MSALCVASSVADAQHPVGFYPDKRQWVLQGAAVPVEERGGWGQGTTSGRHAATLPGSASAKMRVCSKPSHFSRLALGPAALTLFLPAAKTKRSLLVTSRWAVSQGPVPLQLLGWGEPRGPRGSPRGVHVGQASVSAGRGWCCRVGSDTSGQCTALGVAQGGRAAPPPCSEGSGGVRA